MPVDIDVSRETLLLLQKSLLGLFIAKNDLITRVRVKKTKMKKIVDFSFFPAT